MPGRDDAMGQIEDAIAAQEALRATLGDAIVDVTVAALRAQLAVPPASLSLLLGGSPERFVTPELAARLRASGRGSGERRQVTVLFADLTGHTALGEELDPEDLAALSNDVLRVLAEAVYAYEGVVDKYLGDSVLALFGAPIAHEDDPVRALRAALMMREQLERVNRAWAARLSEPLTLHFGINTGVVVAGELGNDLHLEYTVIGDTINTASRLQAVAAPGEILVSRDTFRLAEHAFIFEALDPILIKGKREPVPVFALQRSRLRPLMPGERPGISTALVGRTAELAILRAIGRGLKAGYGRILVVSGEAGVGKSRLLAEWRRELGENVRWLEGRALVQTGALAYGPFIDLVRHLAGITDDHTEGEARNRLRQAITTVFPDDPEALALFASFLTMRLTPDDDLLLGGRSAEWRRQRLIELIRTGLVSLSRAQPTVVVIEDLHWADASTIELIGRLLPLAENQPVVLALVSRNADDPRLAELTRAISSNQPTRLTTLNLGPLTEAQSATLVDQLLAHGALPETLRESIVERTAGNPFYLEEVVRSLIERGILIRSEDGNSWTATALAETVSVPDTLQGLLMSRLDRLPSETKWTIQQAAVIGRIFLYRVLRQIADSAALDSDLSHLEREELIRKRVSDPELEFMFKHALTQEIAYANLLAPRRRTIHRRVGEALEVLMVDRLTEYNGAIANHYWRGEVWDKASTFLIWAGDAAAWLGANAEARHLYADCLTALTHVDPNVDNQRLRVDALLKLVEVALTADEPDRNLERLAEAEQILTGLIQENGDNPAERRRMAWVYQWRGRVQYYASDIPAALRSYNQVLAAAQGIDDRRLLTYPSSAIGASLFFQGHFRKSLPLLTQALQGLDEVTDRREWLSVAHYRALAVGIMGDYRSGLAEINRASARAREFGNQSLTVFSYVSLATLLFNGGEYERCLEAASTAAGLSEASGDRLYHFVSLLMRQYAETRLGRIVDAGSTYSQAKSVVDVITSSGGRPPYAPAWMAVNAELALAREDLANAIDLVAVGITSAGDTDLYNRGIFQLVRVQALLKLGSMGWPAAQSILDNTAKDFEAIGAILPAARLHAIWARLCREYDDPLCEIEHVAIATAVYDAAGLSGKW